MAGDITIFAVYDYGDLVGLYTTQDEAEKRRLETIEEYVDLRPDDRPQAEAGIKVRPLTVHERWTPRRARATTPGEVSPEEQRLRQIFGEPSNPV